MAYRQTKLSKVFENLRQKLEQDNIDEERQVTEEVDQIKRDYIEQNGVPSTSSKTTNSAISLYRPAMKVSRDK